MEKRQRIEKAQAQAELKEKFSKAKSVILVDFRGLKVADDTKLRKLCRQNDVEYKVVKNTLAMRACAELGWKDVTDLFQGTTAAAYSFKDPVAVARLLQSFSTENPALKIKGGILDGQKMSPEQVSYLATLPSKEELIAKVAGSMKAPMYALVTVLGGTLAGFVRAVNALKEKREKEA